MKKQQPKELESFINFSGFCCVTLDFTPSNAPDLYEDQHGNKWSKTLQHPQNKNIASYYKYMRGRPIILNLCP